MLTRKVDQLIEFLKKPMNIILMGTIITICGALFGGLVAAVGTYLQNKKTSERGNRMESGINQTVEIGKTTGNDVTHLKVQNVELMSKIDEQAKTIDQLRKENTNLYTELREANEITNSNIRGGEEAIRIDVASTNITDFICFVENENKYPVRGLNIHVTNYDDAIKCNLKKHPSGKYVINKLCFDNNSGSLIFPEIAIGRYILNNQSLENEKLGLIGISSREYSRYQISFKWLNKIFFQQLVCRKFKSTIYTSSRFFVTSLPATIDSKYTPIEVRETQELKAKLEGWKVDFDREFPKGILDLAADI